MNNNNKDHNYYNNKDNVNNNSGYLVSTLERREDVIRLISSCSLIGLFKASKRGNAVQKEMPTCVSGIPPSLLGLGLLQT